MLSIFAIVLGVFIIGSAIAADRSARTCHPICAIFLNMLGIGCLILGLLSVFAWHHRGVQSHQHQIAAAIPDSSDATVVVRMVIGENGQLEYPTSTATHPDSAHAEVDRVQAEADPPAEEMTEAEAAEKLEADLLLQQIEQEGIGEAAAAESTSAEETDPIIAHVEIDYEARPDWVDQPDRDLGDLHLISITGGPCTTLREARKELDRELKLKTDAYIREFVGHPHAAHWVGYDTVEIRQRFVAPDRIYDEKVVSPSFGDMHQSHALLEFGPAFHNEVEQTWHNVLARTQLVKVALAGGAVFGMLVLLFGYFNADSATRGFYSGRLKFATAVAILAVIATGFFIAQSIPWLWI